MLVMGLAPSLWTNTIQAGVHPPAVNGTAIHSYALQISSQGEAQR